MSYSKVSKNKYRIFISDGFNLDGSRRRPSTTVTTDLKGRDLKEFLKRAEVEFSDTVRKREPKFDKLAKGTFEAYSIWWIEKKEIFDKLAPKTKHEYQKLLDARILPSIGNKILSKITNGDMLDLIEIIEKSQAKTKSGKLSNSSIKHYHTLLKVMFNDAVKFKILTENPMNNISVKTPKIQLKDNYYELDDIDKLLKLLPKAPIKYQLITLLALTTGLRIGEITGLQWRHINYSTIKLKIEQANSYVAKTGSFIKTPKNDTSAREVAFPTFLLPLFKKYEQNELNKKELSGDKWYYGKGGKHEDDFVFTQKNGRFVNVEAPSIWFHQFIKRHGLRHITFHGLRHTNATILISKGIDIVDISKELGHAKTSTTEDFYAHVLKSSERKKADIFDNICTKNQNESQQNNHNGTKSGTIASYLRVVK
ncbi:tyrosine-type recombinase/integrase [Sporanaerobacter sp. PP17-6a]|uniref:tyrosine-type recombinase/integrase n=1 Tax=Sporanaerobacter sp. PP17-6a TaxID=1891289 RepID=UPI00089FF152|nr:site-specific integrase [Sporanaerobacter sp. PP17-6a]SCL87896.1 putative prophage phiRv2 integrase [Sporanaerobacter sp. PP17-6a]